MVDNDLFDFGSDLDSWSTAQSQNAGRGTAGTAI
jgi:hypothetical protein